MKAYEKRRKVKVSVRADMLDLILWRIMGHHHLGRNDFTCPICLNNDGSKHKEGCELGRAILEGQRLKNEIPDDPPSQGDDEPLPFREIFTNNASNYHPSSWRR